MEQKDSKTQAATKVYMPFKKHSSLKNKHVEETRLGVIFPNSFNAYLYMKNV